MQWVREYSKPHKLELKYNPRRDDWKNVQDTLWGAKDWCIENNMTFRDDGLFYIRFTNEDDLAWFLLRWA